MKWLRFSIFQPWKCVVRSQDCQPASQGSEPRVQLADWRIARYPSSTRRCIANKRTHLYRSELQSKTVMMSDRRCLLLQTCFGTQEPQLLMPHLFWNLKTNHSRSATVTTLGRLPLTTFCYCSLHLTTTHSLAVIIAHSLSPRPARHDCQPYLRLQRKR